MPRGALLKTWNGIRRLFQKRLHNQLQPKNPPFSVLFGGILYDREHTKSTLIELERT